MKGKILSLLAAAALGGSLLMAPPAQAGKGTFSNAVAEGEVTVYDQTFEVSGCTEVPVNILVLADNSDVYWSADVTARLEGTMPSNSTFMSARGTSFEQSSFTLCPSFDEAGRWQVRAEITFIDYRNDRERVATVTTSFTMAKRTTFTSITRMKSSGVGLDVTGKVKANSLKYGSVGVPGEVLIQVRRGREWVEVGSGYADRRGVFTATVYDPLPQRSRLRAFYPGDDATRASASFVRRL